MSRSSDMNSSSPETGLAVGDMNGEDAPSQIDASYEEKLKDLRHRKYLKVLEEDDLFQDSDGDDDQIEEIDRLSATERNTDLWRLLKDITGKDLQIEAFDPAAMTEGRKLKEFQMLVASIGEVEVPKDFICPISGEIMKDPVIIADDKAYLQTYDRLHLQKWFNQWRRRCPETKKDFHDPYIIPNTVLRDIISKWCNDRIDPAANVHEAHHDEMISSVPISKEKMLIGELRKFFKDPHFMYKKSIGEVLSLLSGVYDCLHSDLQEGLLEIILEISLHDEEMKDLIVGNNGFMILLKKLLQIGTITTQTQAVAIISALSTSNSNQEMLGEFALEEIVCIIEEANAVPVTESFTALLRLCQESSNHKLAADCGVFDITLNAIHNETLADILVEILFVLTDNEESNIKELDNLEAVSFLLPILRKRRHHYTQELAVQIIHDICKHNMDWLEEVRQEEEQYHTILKLSNKGNQAARETATNILELLYPPPPTEPAPEFYPPAPEIMKFLEECIPVKNKRTRKPDDNKRKRIRKPGNGQDNP